MRVAVSLGRSDLATGRLIPELWLADAATGQVLCRWPVVGEHSPPDGDHCGSPTWLGARLLQPLRAEVRTIDLDSGRSELWSSHEQLHDVHSASWSSSGALLLTSTGIESVIALRQDGSVERQWLLGDPPPAGDLRRYPHDAFRPHRHHPNHAVEVDGRVLVTRLASRDCVDLLDPSFRLTFPEGPPHDGRLHEDRVWFTTTNGWVIAFEVGTWRRVLALRVDRSLAWCRGIDVDGECLWVGLSRLRRPTSESAVKGWARRVTGRRTRSSVLEVHWPTGRVRRRLAIDAPGGAEIYGVTLVR